MNKIIYIALFAAIVLSSCFTAKGDHDQSEAGFAKKNTALIEEMAGYAILFSKNNQVNDFETKNIMDKEVRKKMGRLGRTVTLTYQFGSGHIIDSTVIFKSITTSHGVLEYLYDFSVNPRGKSVIEGHETVLIQVSDRIYYRRRPFPMM